MAGLISNKGVIGDIQESMLTEAQFQAQSGASWVLADGRSAAGTRYAAITGFTNIPDLRGVFLRGKNNGRADGNQNPAGETGLGVYQADAFQGHYHSIYGVGGQGLNPGDADRVSSGNNLLSNGQVREATTDGTNGTPRTASETRTKNVTVNIFIKIN